MSDRATDSAPRVLAARSVSDALRSCATPLGVPVGYLETPRLAAILREGDDATVVRTFARGAVGVVSLPGAEVCDLDLDDASVQELLALTRSDASPGSVVVVDGVQLEIDDDPAALVIADRGTLASAKPHVRAALVYDPRPAVLDMLRSEVSPAEWTTGGGDRPSPHRVGALAGGVLVALASVEQPVGHIARVRVLVTPSCRRRGFGRLVLSTLAGNVVKEGLLPFGRLASADLAGRALAQSVGFVPFARSLTLRLNAVQDGQGVLPVNALA